MTREEAIEIIEIAKAETEWNYPLDYQIAFDEAIEALKQPEQKHGKWMYDARHNRAICTECLFERDLDVNFGCAKACPNCGANMDLR